MASDEVLATASGFIYRGPQQAGHELSQSTHSMDFSRRLSDGVTRDCKLADCVQSWRDQTAAQATAAASAHFLRCTATSTCHGSESEEESNFAGFCGSAGRADVTAGMSSRVCEVRLSRLRTHWAT